ncbi:MAG: TIGR03435 family protein [Vicinamibacterales bacterium]
MASRFVKYVKSFRAATLIASLAGAVALAAQVPQEPPPGGWAFEVASIKPNSSGDGRVMMQNQPGRFVATNITLRLLIRNAYQLQDFQITGGQGWIGSDHFDINAKVPDELRAMAPPAPGSGPGPLQLMMRALLAERFKLAVHNETKDSPIYALVLARSDGKLGSGLRKSNVDCAAVFAAARARGGAMPPPGPPPGERMPCGMRVGPGNLSGGGALMPQFANTLGMFAGRIVLDRTGLQGAYDVDLTWTPDQMPQRPPGAPDQPVQFNGASIDPNGPSLFTAVQEQLGLKLDSQRGPVDILVIDRAEKPVEN